MSDVFDSTSQHSPSAPSVDRHVYALERLVAVVRDLSQAHDLEAVMAVVRVAARELTGADGATFVLKDDNQCYYAEENAISPLWKGQRFPMEACISGWAMLNKQVAVIEDIYQDARIPHDAYRPTFVKSLVMVPVRQNDPIAAIGNYWQTCYAPTPEEVRLLQSLADATSVALQNVQLYDALVQAKQVAETAKEQYRMLIEGVQDYAIFMLDSAGRVVTWNEGGERLTGYSAEDMVGQSLERFYPAEDIQLGKPDYELQVAKTTGRYEGEGWHLRQDGTRYWAVEMVTPLYDSEAQLMGFSKMIRDLSALKEAEAATERALLTNIRKDAFLASTSHELRTPLHTIITGSSVLLEGMLGGTLSEKQREYLTLINRSGDHLLSLINDLLDIAKIDAGKMTLNIQNIPLASWLTESVDLVRPLLTEKEQTLHVTQDTGVPTTMACDPLRLKQILCNLLSNAVKFSPVGSSIYIRCAVETGENPQFLILSVRDEGIGFTDAEKERILMPFEQGEHTPPGTIKGTGLGLSLSKKLIELHGGTLEVHSVVNEGSTFSIHLPLNAR